MIAYRIFTLFLSTVLQFWLSFLSLLVFEIVALWDQKYIAKPLGSMSLESFSNCFERSQKMKSVDKTFKTQID